MIAPIRGRRKVAHRREIPANERLIVALDVSTVEEAQRIVDELASTVNFFKVGLQLYVATGLQVVERLVAQKLNVFLDMKMEDEFPSVRL